MLTKYRARKHFVRACKSEWFDRSKHIVELINQNVIMTPYLASVITASVFTSQPNAHEFDEDYKLRDLFNFMWSDGQIKRAGDKIEKMCEGQTRNEITDAMFAMAFTGEELRALNDVFTQMDNMLGRAV